MHLAHTPPSAKRGATAIVLSLLLPNMPAPCLAHSAHLAKQPLNTKKLPRQPWQSVCADIASGLCALAPLQSAHPPKISGALFQTVCLACSPGERG
ncbi:unnamed protein product [Boreogadus saida]